MYVARLHRSPLLKILLLAAVLAAPAQAAPNVAATGTLTTPAHAIVAGPDGAFWHTAAGKAPNVGRTTLLGQTVEQPLPKTAPGAIIRGPGNALWFTDESGTIRSITLAGTVSDVAEIPKGTPRSLAMGADGNVWVSLVKDRAIARVTPAGDVTLFDANLTGDPQDLALGWDGALWFTEPSADQIGRITLAGDITEFPAEGQPTSVTPAFDAGVWFTAAKGSIGRIALDGTVTTFDAGAASKPDDIALGADGALWFTRKKGIGRITTAGELTSYPTKGMQPGALTLGWDGAMWFTDTKKPLLGRISLSGSAAPVAPPVLGRTVVAAVKRGRVKVKTPGAERFQPVSAATSLPVGSVIDANNGRVRLRTATKAGTQTGTFYGGRFKVRQKRRGRGVVGIALRGRLDCGRGRGASISRRKKRRRSIWGLDLGGLFETLGLDSVTTVRGTKWLTVDRCDGTLTKVVRGSVVVRERATGKRVVVRAGERYLARHRP